MQLEFHQRGALWARRWEHLRVRHRARQRRLMVSLAAAGQQTPIVVVAAEGQADRYVVIDGYKRIAALQQLGRDTVEAVVWPMGEAEAVLLDRSLRFSEQETALEQGRLLQELEQRFGWGLDELAHRLAEPKAAAPGRAWRARSARRRGARSIAPAASWPGAGLPVGRT
ncbi:MAG: ParB N-terminal domain-containing protein [Chloroflexi bacterium]|nr:ParB N-terminal domain-containing protein [Chloroflexota bacterium]